MRPSCLSLAIAVIAPTFVGTAFAADIAIPRLLPPPKEISVQKGPPKCSRWTDDCVNCSRGADGGPAVCSNTGFSCQPKPVRCLEP